MSGKLKSNVEGLEPLLAVLITFQGIVRWLIGFFTLTEEDRLAAGIDTSYKSHDG